MSASDRSPEPLSEELENKLPEVALEILHAADDTEGGYGPKLDAITPLLRAFAREITIDADARADDAHRDAMAAIGMANLRLAQLLASRESARSLAEALEALTINTGCADGDCCEAGFKHTAAIERGEEVLAAYRGTAAPGGGKP